MAQPRGSAQDERTDARSSARATLTRMQDAGVRAADALRTVDSSQWQLPGLIASLLLLPFAGWSILRLRALRLAPAAAPPSTQVAPRALSLQRASAEPAHARLWAARTLAGQGLDAAEISERTGLCRDAATLLVGYRR